MAQSDDNQPFEPLGSDPRQSRALVERRETLPSTEVIRDWMTDEEEEDSINLRQYWAVIMRRKWTVLTFFAIVVVAGMTATYLTTPIYRASTTLQPDWRAFEPCLTVPHEEYIHAGPMAIVSIYGLPR